MSTTVSSFGQPRRWCGPAHVFASCLVSRGALLCGQGADASQIGDKVAIAMFFGPFIRNTEQVGRVHSDEAGTTIEGCRPPRSADRKRFACQREDRSRAEGHD